MSTALAPARALATHPETTAPSAEPRSAPSRRPVVLRSVPALGTAAVPEAPSLAPPPLREVPRRPTDPTPPARAADGFAPVDPDVTPLRSLETPTADPGRVCASILQVAGEAMRGIRPLSQLARWVDGDIFDELAGYAPTHGARTSVRQRLEPGAVAAVLARGRLWKVRVARISAHVAECTVLARTPERVRAVVVRLEARGTSWRATALGAL